MVLELIFWVIPIRRLHRRQGKPPSSPEVAANALSRATLLSSTELTTYSQQHQLQ
ncbi:MAG: hypothetical protein AB1589_08440 [Cyanobacteriota bacterium]